VLVFGQAAEPGLVIGFILKGQFFLIRIDFLFQLLELLLPRVLRVDAVFAGIGLEKTAIDTPRFTTKELQFFAQQNEITISGG